MWKYLKSRQFIVVFLPCKNINLGTNVLTANGAPWLNEKFSSEVTLLAFEGANEVVSCRTDAVGLQDTRDLAEQGLPQLVEFALEARASAGRKRQQVGPPRVVMAVQVDEVAADPAPR